MNGAPVLSPVERAEAVRFGIHDDEAFASITDGIGHHVRCSWTEPCHTPASKRFVMNCVCRSSAALACAEHAAIVDARFERGRLCSHCGRTVLIWKVVDL